MNQDAFGTKGKVDDFHFLSLAETASLPLRP